MLRLDIRKKPAREDSQAVGQVPQRCAVSVLKRFSSPDWIKPWLNPALSRMLDLRASRQKGGYRQHSSVLY